MALNLNNIDSQIFSSEIKNQRKKSTNNDISQVDITNEKYLYPNGHRITHQMRWFKGSRDRGFNFDSVA